MSVSTDDFKSQTLENDSEHPVLNSTSNGLGMARVSSTHMAHKQTENMTLFIRMIMQTLAAINIGEEISDFELLEIENSCSSAYVYSSRKRAFFPLE